MFAITGLDPTGFDHLFRLGDAALATAGARRVVADGPGYPCRVSLVDAAPGEELVLFEYRHHDVASPYRASGASNSAIIWPRFSVQGVSTSRNAVLPEYRRSSSKSSRATWKAPG